MGVRVDKSRRHPAVAGVDHIIAAGFIQRGGADAQQFTVTDTQVAEHSRRAAAIEKLRVLDQHIEHQQGPGRIHSASRA
jgi:hypothetical protein